VTEQRYKPRASYICVARIAVWWDACNNRLFWRNYPESEAVWHATEFASRCSGANSATPPTDRVRAGYAVATWLSYVSA
jgi:hypothetical protein